MIYTDHVDLMSKVLIADGVSRMAVYQLIEDAIKIVERKFEEHQDYDVFMLRCVEVLVEADRLYFQNKK